MAKINVLSAMKYVSILVEVLSKVELLKAGELVDAVVKFGYKGKKVKLNITVE